ncbi:putative nuclease HARBI1 [Dreissena polymorpha]|uniref:putative nuclease HARBI1 n=1 Tax=Dreissena polymorpha TaxID=45954 RepID=UPI0022645347|nr:putative nuclease HARBI1 [Dreissena polymorpha]
MYVNRMGYHSINTQIVFDHNDMIMDVVARWPGSTHDSRILRGSGLWQVFDRNLLPQNDHFLLGDSGYPCKRWPLTPYVRPANNAQEAYNRAHKLTRSKVERGIGQLKRRWGILHGEVRLAPEKTCKVIIACAVLHNICKLHGVPDVDDLPEDPVRNDGIHVGPEDGLRFRDIICEQYFRL